MMAAAEITLRMARLLRAVTFGIALAVVLGSTFAAPRAAADTATWGPSVGEPIPMLDAQDQAGVRRNLDDLRGDHGLLLFLVRSADW